MHRCYYCCGTRNVEEPYVDAEGIGWAPCCMYPSCHDWAQRDAERQRQAIKEHDKKHADVGELVVPAD